MLGAISKVDGKLIKKALQVLMHKNFKLNVYGKIIEKGIPIQWASDDP